jgi:heme/copper-type cytochrome/quinol oxidase subunit 3
MHNFFFLIAFHILHVFLPNILVHYTLIEYAYI